MQCIKNFEAYEEIGWNLQEIVFMGGYSDPKCCLHSPQITLDRAIDDGC